MNSIHQLDDKSINQIAAGEVIERPSSVVKELVENSLDAGATEIDLWLEEGGRQLIQIRDNGQGMSFDDLSICYQRYTTSKIQCAEDIFYISSNGFRGEALSSIASVSQLRIESRYRENDVALSMQIENLQCLHQEETAREIGTTISVRNLFYNTPVRLKFLSSVSAENTRVIAMLTRLSLANPHCRFRLFHNGKEVFSATQPDTLQRLGEVLGSRWVKKSLPINFSKGPWVLEGFVGNEEMSKSRRQHQYFYLEGRPIQNILIAKAIDKAFQQFYPGRLPVCFLNLHLPPETFDVNVHPTKKEVRFHNESEVFSFVYQGVHQDLRAQLQDADLRLNTEAKPAQGGINPFDRLENLVFAEKPPERTEPQDLFSQPDFLNRVVFKPQVGSSPNAISHSVEVSPEKIDIPFLQVNLQYLMVETHDKLLIIDQYHAHFRILFEEYRQRLTEGNFIAAQQLMFPEILEFTAEESSALEHEIDRLFKLGFDLVPFGGNSFKLSGVPQDLDTERAIETLRDFTSQIGEAQKDQLADRFIISIAASRAIRKGTRLSQNEMNELFDSLFACQNPYVDPRGKPTLMQWPLDDIHKKFR